MSSFGNQNEQRNRRSTETYETMSARSADGYARNISPMSMNRLGAHTSQNPVSPKHNLQAQMGHAHVTPDREISMLRRSAASDVPAVRVFPHSRISIASQPNSPSLLNTEAQRRIHKQPPHPRYSIDDSNVVSQNRDRQVISPPLNRRDSGLAVPSGIEASMRPQSPRLRTALTSAGSDINGAIKAGHRQLDELSAFSAPTLHIKQSSYSASGVSSSFRSRPSAAHHSDDIVTENDHDGQGLSRGTTPAAHRIYKALVKEENSNFREERGSSIRGEVTGSGGSKQRIASYQLTGQHHERSANTSRYDDRTNPNNISIPRMSSPSLRPSQQQQQQKREIERTPPVATGRKSWTQGRSIRSHKQIPHSVPEGRSFDEDDDDNGNGSNQDEDELDDTSIRARRANAAAAAVQRGIDPEEVESKVQAELSEKRLLKAALKLQSKEPAWLRDLRHQDSFVSRRNKSRKSRANSHDNDVGDDDEDDDDSSSSRETWGEFLSRMRLTMRRSWTRMGLFTKFLYLLYITIFALAITSLILGIGVNRQLIGSGDGCVTTTIVYNSFVILFSLWTIWSFYTRSPRNLYAIFFFSLVLATYGYLVAFLEGTCIRPPISNSNFYSFERRCPISEVDTDKTSSPSTKFKISNDCCTFFGNHIPTCACFWRITGNPLKSVDFASWKVPSCAHAERAIHNLSVIRIFSIFTGTGFMVYILWWYFLRKKTYLEWAQQFQSKVIRRRARAALELINNLKDQASLRTNKNKREGELDEEDHDIDGDNSDDINEDYDFGDDGVGDQEMNQIASSLSTDSLALRRKREKIRRRRLQFEKQILCGYQGEDPKEVKRRIIHLAARIALTDVPLIIGDEPSKYDYIPTRTGLRRLEPGLAIESKPILLKLQPSDTDETGAVVSATMMDVSLPPALSVPEANNQISNGGSKVMGLVGLSSKEINRRKREQSMNESELIRRSANNPLQPDVESEFFDDTSLEQIGDSENESSDEEDVIRVIECMQKISNTPTPTQSPESSFTSEVVRSPPSAQRAPSSTQIRSSGQRSYPSNHAQLHGGSTVRGSVLRIAHDDDLDHDDEYAQETARRREVELSNRNVSPKNIHRQRIESQNRYAEAKNGEVEMTNIPSSRMISPDFHKKANSHRNDYANSAVTHQSPRLHPDGSMALNHTRASDYDKQKMLNMRIINDNGNRIPAQVVPKSNTQLTSRSELARESTTTNIVENRPVQTMSQVQRRPPSPHSQRMGETARLSPHPTSQAHRATQASTPFHTMPTSGTITPSNAGTPVTYRLAYAPSYSGTSRPQSTNTSTSEAREIALRKKSEQESYAGDSYLPNLEKSSQIAPQDRFVFKPDSSNSPASNARPRASSLSGHSIAQSHPNMVYRPPSVPATPHPGHNNVKYVHDAQEGGSVTGRDQMTTRVAVGKGFGKALVYDDAQQFDSIYDDDDEYSIAYLSEQKQ